MLHILDLPTELLLHISAHLFPAPPPSSAGSSGLSLSADASPTASSYAHFRAYLALRHTCRTLHALLPLPTYTALLAQVSVFEEAGWLPCEKCVRTRPSNFFFGGVRRDGIGPYFISTTRSSRLAPPPRACIDCIPHPVRDRFFFTPLSSHSSSLGSSSSSRRTNGAVAGSNTNPSNSYPSSSGRMYCICACCGSLGRSSLNMQVCAACFDEDFGGDVAPSQCHRRRLEISGLNDQNGMDRPIEGDLFGDILRAEEEKRLAVRNRGAGGQGGPGGGPEGDAAWERMQFGLGTFLGGSGG